MALWFGGSLRCWPTHWRAASIRIFGRRKVKEPAPIQPLAERHKAIVRRAVLCMEPKRVKRQHEIAGRKNRAQARPAPATECVGQQTVTCHRSLTGFRKLARP